MIQRGRSRRVEPLLWVRLLSLAGLIVAPSLQAAELTTALEIRRLTAAQAAERHPVRLRAMVTFNDSPGAVFVQDATAGALFRPGGVVGLKPGDEVEIQGYTQPALYMPGIERATFRVVGQGPSPIATPVNYSDLVSGRFHYQWVAVEGIVRSVVPIDDGRIALRLALSTEIVEVMIKTSPEGVSPKVDSLVRVRGLASGRINSRRQLVRPYLQSAGWQDVDLLEPAPAPERIRTVSTAELLTFEAAGNSRRRVCVVGTILALFQDGTAFLRDDKGSVAVDLDRAKPIDVGDALEVIGFPEMTRFSASLADAEIRARKPGARPAAIEVSMPELFERNLDGELVKVTGMVREWIREADATVLMLRGAGKVVRAHVPGVMSGVEPGSSVSVTGICQVESTDVQPYRAVPLALSLRVRELADVVVTRSPPWWTTRRLLYALLVAAAAVLMGMGWIFVLRRQVHHQTQALRQKIERETSLEERQRLAREFHDTLEQDLTGVSFQLSTATARGFDQKGVELVASSRNLIERIQRETRILVSDLREDGARAAGPVDLVLELKEIARERGTEGSPSFHVAASVESFKTSAPIAYHLRMIFQEAITNVLKHARAGSIRLGLESREGGVLLTITDDGNGFDPSVETIGKRGHFGCMGIRERCVKIGATVAWRSSPGKGTTVEIGLSQIAAGARQHEPVHSS
jgi:signal transduction histidine kinase